MVFGHMQNDECGMMNHGQFDYAPLFHASSTSPQSSFPTDAADLAEEEVTYERNRLVLIAIEELP